MALKSSPVKQPLNLHSIFFFFAKTILPSLKQQSRAVSRAAFCFVLFCIMWLKSEGAVATGRSVAAGSGSVNKVQGLARVG